MLKVGDVVRLKTGGQHMTIVRIDHGKAWCDWYEDARLFKESFPLAMLKHAEEDFDPPRISHPGATG